MGFPPAGQKHQMALKCSTKRGQVRQVVPAARHKRLWRWELVCGVVGRCLWGVGGGIAVLPTCPLARNMSCTPTSRLNWEFTTAQLISRATRDSHLGNPLVRAVISKPGPSTNRIALQKQRRPPRTDPSNNNKYTYPRRQVGRAARAEEIRRLGGPVLARPSRVPQPHASSGSSALRTARSAIPRPLFFVWVALLASLAKRAAVAA